MEMDLLPPGRRLPVYEFVWAAPKKRAAYQWVERPLRAFRGKPTALVLAERADAKLGAYRPLDEATGLFLDFAAVEPTPEGCLAFANRYGLLGPGAEVDVVAVADATVLPTVHYPGDEPKALARRPKMEPFDFWRDSILWMRHLTTLWRLAEEPDRAGLARYVAWEGNAVVHCLPDIPRSEFLAPRPRWSGRLVWPDPRAPSGERLFRAGDLEGPALKLVQEEVADSLRGAVNPTLIWSVERGRPEMTIRPTGLLSALCLQFALSVAHGWKYGTCPVCGRSFVLLPGVNRTNRVTCSTTCRTYLYRQRKDRARGLHAAGKSVKQIAKELNAKPENVKSWIAKEQ
jgi:hypothetical protein